jgi:hypothetical protein
MKSSTFFIFATLAFASASFAACSSSTAPATSSNPSADASTTTPTGQNDASAPTGEMGWTEEMLNAACAREFQVSAARWERCFGYDPNPGDTLELSIASCKARLRLPGNGFTPESFEACSQANETTPCGEALEACDVPGQLPNGTACRIAGECQSGFCEYPEGKTDDAGVTTFTVPACGKCAAIGGEGASCNEEDSAPNCGVDLSCVGGKCVKSLALGAACSLTEGPQCAGDGARCIEDTCQKPPRVAVGGTCTTSAECGLFVKCSPEKKCVAPTWKAPGELCTGFNDLCQVGYFCPTVTVPGGGTEKRCPTALALGDACSPGDDTKSCPNNAGCFEGKCESLYEPACK